MSDTSIHCKMVIPTENVSHLLTFWTREQITEGIDLRVYDMDEGREINEIFRLKYQRSCNICVFEKGWSNFANYKALHNGDTVQFFWNSWSSRIHFRTKERDPAPPGGHRQWTQEPPWLTHLHLPADARWPVFINKKKIIFYHVYRCNFNGYVGRVIQPVWIMLLVL